jgi:hypothetical protein
MLVANHARGRAARTALAGLTAAGLLLAACSAGEDAAAPEQAPTEATPAQTAPPAESEPDEPEAEPEPEPTETAPTLPEAPEAVRGVYATVYSFWGERWAHLVDLVETTELNAIVVDVKDEAGTLLWPIEHPYTAAGGADWKPNGDPTERLQQLLDAGGYAIARVSCFKDTLVAQAHPELAVQEQGTGRAWLGRKDFAWLNPYADGAGQWCIDVGIAAVEAGFHEVQFDYIRFPNGGDGDTTTIELPGVPDDRPREQWRHPDEVVEFLARATEQVHAAGGLVSADLFGLVTYDFTWDAQGTGQVIERIAEHVDFISPMVYPSHYGPGNYGLLPHPVDFPYETVWNAMQEAQMRVQGLHAEIRPWLEDFAAPWMGRDHSPARLEAQIQATYDNGIEGWLLWNAGNSYSESVLSPGATELKAADVPPPARTADPNAAPGAEEIQWPGRPTCGAGYPPPFIGEGNLAGSTPPTPAAGADDPAACPPPDEPSEGDDAAGDDASDDTDSASVDTDSASVDDA